MCCTSIPGSNGTDIWHGPKPGEAHDTQGALLGVGQVAKHTYLMDWNKTKAFATTPTSNGIYVVVSDGNSPGVPAAEYPAFLKEAFR